jgi:hypothetical protein
MYLKEQRGPWKIDLDFAGEALHVRPRNDRAWHVLAEECPCRPSSDVAELKDSDGDPVHLPVYFHAALDGRTVPPPRPGTYGHLAGE